MKTAPTSFITVSGDRVKYVGASVLVEADNRYLLGVLPLFFFWFCHFFLDFLPLH
jgi:hypothetical protein